MSLNFTQKKLQSLIDMQVELNERLIAADPSSEQYRELSKRFAASSAIAEGAQLMLQGLSEKAEAEEMLELESLDAEMKELVELELDTLDTKLKQQEIDLQFLLLPKDEADERNALLEIRAGTGGEEASLFAMDLFRLYQRFSSEQGWKFQTLSYSETGAGGLKEGVVKVSGSNVFARLKYESGVHRVQRVPETEASGRIHTSAATVAVMPEAEEIDIKIEEKDLRIETYRASGAGGQHVNTTDSAVRITHIPSGVVVTCQDEKSQHKNKAKAMSVVRARIYDHQRQEQAQLRAADRKSQVGSGDRSERIRTYNFPQGRVTDHRINLTLYRLQDIMDGDLIEFIEALQKAAHMEQLQNLNDTDFF